MSENLCVCLCHSTGLPLDRLTNPVIKCCKCESWPRIKNAEKLNQHPNENISDVMEKIVPVIMQAKVSTLERKVRELEYSLNIVDLTIEGLRNDIKKLANTKDKIDA